MKLKRIAAILFLAVCLTLATLTVSAAETSVYLPGDLNYDGFVNTTDVVYLRRFIAGGYGVDLTPPTQGCRHFEVIDPAVEPTCTQTGLTEGKHCSLCGEVLVAQNVIAAKGHTMVDGICTVCNFVELEFSTRYETVYTTAGSLYLREAPHSAGAIYCAVTKGQELLRVGYHETWSKVMYDGKLLYCNSAYLSTQKPSGNDGISEVIERYAALKQKYINPNGNGKYYLPDDYAHLCILFDKAAIDLQRATTVASAETIVVMLEVNASSIKNAKTDAAAVRAQIENLGDVETEVFTTSMEKVEKAYMALCQFLWDYEELFHLFDDPKYSTIEDAQSVYDFYIKSADDAQLNAFLNDTWGLEIDYLTLSRAEAKIHVLKSYIVASLSADMKTLYDSFEYDFSEDGDDLFAKVGQTTAYNIIDQAYYHYQVIAAINGGDVSAADVAVDWDYLYDEQTGKVVKAPANCTLINPRTGKLYQEGDKIYDKNSPCAWFTAEDFMKVYVTPYLNYTLQKTKDAAVDQLHAKLTVPRGSVAAADIYKNIAGTADNKYVVSSVEVKDALEDIAESFADEMEDLTFVGNYKGNSTMSDAQVEVWTMYVNAYIAAANAIIEMSAYYAPEIYQDEYELAADALMMKYEGKTDAASQAILAQKLAELKSKKDAFEANVQAAPTYTLEMLNDIELIKKHDENYDREDPYYDIVRYNITPTNVNAKLLSYIDKVFVEVLNTHFRAGGAVQTGLLGDAAHGATEELLALRDRLDPTNEYAVNPLYNAVTRGTEISYKDGSNYVGGKYYSNIAAFEKILIIIDDAIEAIRNVNVEDFVDKETHILTTDGLQFGDRNRKAKLYWVNREAKDYVEAEGYSDGWLYSHENSTDTWYASTPAKITYQAANDADGNPVYKTEYLKIHAKDENGNYQYALDENSGIVITTDYSKKTISNLIHAERLDNGEYVICNCEQKIGPNSKIAVYETHDKGLVISNTSRTGDFLTLDDTGLPFTYTRTAEEQAVLMVSSLYKAAFESVHKAIMALDTLNYLPLYVDKITGASEYKKILSNVSGSPELTAEITDFANVYTGYLSTINNGLVYAFSNERFTPMGVVRTMIAQPGFAAGTESAYFTCNATPNNAMRYTYNNVETCMASIVAQFDSKFYTNEKTESNVIVLWNYKYDAIKYITDKINGYEFAGIWNAGYKNTYKVEVVNEQAVVTPHYGTLYKYDIGLKAASADGKAFDARLTELLDSYVAKIKGVRLNANSDVKDFYGNKLASRADTAYQGGIGAGLRTGRWTLATAKRTVNAYVVDLLGHAEAGIYTANVMNPYANTDYIAVDGTVYATGDSQVLVAFKNYYERSYAAYAPVKK